MTGCRATPTSYDVRAAGYCLLSVYLLSYEAFRTDVCMSCKASEEEGKEKRRAKRGAKRRVNNTVQILVQARHDRQHTVLLRGSGEPTVHVLVPFLFRQWTQDVSVPGVLISPLTSTPRCIIVRAPLLALARASGHYYCQFYSRNRARAISCLCFVFQASLLLSGARNKVCVAQQATRRLGVQASGSQVRQCEM